MITSSFGAGIMLAMALVASGGSAALPQTIVGRVVGVTDGDTLTVLQSGVGGAPIERQIRLAGIDAPERHQPFGRQARQTLSGLCYGQTAQINTESVDRYGRVVGEVQCGGVSANLAMVQSGMAWAYVRYQPPAAYIQAEQKARAARIGLWSDPHPIPPWEWRRSGRAF